MTFNPKMPSEIRCPNCHSGEFIDYGELVECSQCGYEFFKEFINSEIDEENILSDQELRSLSETFQDSFKEKKDRKKIIKSIDKDLQDLQK
jgi:hypothetical protein